MNIQQSFSLGSLSLSLSLSLYSSSLCLSLCCREDSSGSGLYGVFDGSGTSVSSCWHPLVDRWSHGLTVVNGRVIVGCLV